MSLFWHEISTAFHRRSIPGEGQKLKTAVSQDSLYMRKICMGNYKDKKHLIRSGALSISATKSNLILRLSFR